MTKRKKLRKRKKWLKPTAFWLWAKIIILLASIVVIADRLICSFWVTKDLPGIREIDKFKHEREELAKRLAFYLGAFVIYSIGWLAWNYGPALINYLKPF